jgi:hypothetical protein
MELPAEGRLSGGRVSIAVEQVVGHNAQILLSNCGTFDYLCLTFSLMHVGQ